jgi:hypothetical protein
MPGRAPDRLLGLAALVVATGVLLSGPVGLLLAAIHPQPPWRDAVTFADHFHPLQVAPFWLGFVLVFGCAFVVVRAAALAGERQRTRAAWNAVLLAMAAAIAVAELRRPT